MKNPISKNIPFVRCFNLTFWRGKVDEMLTSVKRKSQKPSVESVSNNGGQRGASHREGEGRKQWPQGFASHPSTPTITANETSLKSETKRKLVFFGISDAGLKRTNNEDHFIVADLTRKLVGVKNNQVIPELLCHDVGPAGTLLAVADGLGGHEKGEVASSMGVESLVEAFFRLEEKRFSPTHELTNAVFEAHHAIQRYSSNTPQESRMSSTMTAVHVGYDRVTVAQVGDSRAYRFAHGKLVPLTEDQTVVHMMLKRGLISPEEADKHPDRHVILQALGKDGEITPEVQTFPFDPGECLLLCSDGLSSFVSHEEIETIMRTEKDENMRCRRCIEAAYAAGGGDNITVLIARLIEQ
jgi:protein phosphatase